jgi:hypothetical protein
MTQISEGGFRPEYFETVFESSTPLQQLPAQFAIVTAYNPNGEPRGSEENERRDQALRKILERRGIRHWEVTGCSPDGSHREPGYGIQCPIETAVELGRHFEQEAIFWIHNDELTLLSCHQPHQRSVGESTARWRDINKS